MPTNPMLMDAITVKRALTRVAHEIAERNLDGSKVVLVGIQTGGVTLANRLGRLLTDIWGFKVPVGCLDVAMHRDDLNERAAPNIQPTSIPCDINGRTVVIVDDVLFSGRTTRAAMDALADFGRPSLIQLAVLVDRGHRQLPIKADFVGKNIPTSLADRVNVELSEDGERDQVSMERR